jgi:small-conductance mechanosensitive channel
MFNFFKQIQLTIAGHPGDYLLLLIILAGSFIAFKLILMLIIGRLNYLAKTTNNRWDNLLAKGLHKIGWPFLLLVAAWLAGKYSALGAAYNKFFDVLMIIGATWTIARVTAAILKEVVIYRLGQDKNSAGIIQFVTVGSKIILWIIGLLLILSNLGVNVTSLVAGLGVGGIIIAFALQNVLSDLFSSLAIYLDKPFQVGDFISVGADKGWVEKIGIKTTRIKSADGQMIVIGNKDLTNSVIQNFDTLEKRRVKFNLSLEYDTSATKCRLALKIIKEAISSTEHADYERAHFYAFGESALLYEVIYYVEGADYKRYLDVQQSINFKIKRGFEQAEIAMAYPTQTIYQK